MSLFEKLKKEIHSTSTSNFHFDHLDGKTSAWIKGLCDLVDENDCSGCEHYGGLVADCMAPSLTPCPKEQSTK